MIELQVPSTLCLKRGFDVSVQGEFNFFLKFCILRYLLCVESGM